ncbi:MAG: SDR family NAD(P)-dependent oxidoreductase [Deltaproteobacteria bacterium]|nr:SDR family NAD(P)-dependent oxidoreductase [Deltaproteobacteria bacterium]
MGLLDGKVAVVTGAGRGIGRGEALALGAAGATVVVNDLGCELTGSGAETMAADQVAAEIIENGSKAVGDYSDISTVDGVDRLMWTALNKFGRLDILVNNAGIIRDRTLLNMAEDEWDPVINVHLKGTFLCARAAGRIMKAGGNGGAIISTTSIAGLIGAFGHPNYSSAKAGIFGFTRGIAAEMARSGVRVNAICPHAYSRMTAVSEWMQDKQEVYTTDVIGQTIVFLASDLAKDITGRVLGAVGGKEGARVCELKMILSDGHVMAPENLSASEIAKHIDQVLSPLPDLLADHFLAPPKA